MQLSPQADAALLNLLRLLDAEGYCFVAPTPETHRRVLERGSDDAFDLRSMLGWNRPFAADDVRADVLELLDQAGALARESGMLRSRLRVSSLAGTLFLHSSFPTDEEDSVFFGPDSYRFARFIETGLAGRPVAERLVDIGTGSGVGAIVAARLGAARQIVMADVNPVALRLAAINARFAGVEAEFLKSNRLADVDGEPDLILANPPYIADSDGRTYRDGGDLHGGRLSLDWALDGARRLASGGRMLLYSGAAIVDGRDAIREALAESLPALGCRLRYEELDPDVFGEELEKPQYRNVERIAVIGAVIDKS